jgi:phospholipid/cholesterol/gamma-HCH transport system substrate-binding protein
VKNVSATVKVGLLFTLLVVGSYAVWKMVGARPSGASEFQVFAKFKDASGLPLGSRVLVAGLPVGEVEELAIEGRYARVTVRVRDDVVLYENAIIFKKSSSLLGAFYLEIDPGTAESVNARGERVATQKLKPGEEIKNVVEATSPEQLMRRIEESLPNVDAVLLSVKDLSDDLRGVVNGPVASLANRLDGMVRDEAQTIHRILDNADKSLERIEKISADVRRQTAPGGRVDSILENLDGAVKETRTEINEISTKIKEKLDLVDELLVNSSEVAGKLNRDEGTLGRLVNDSTLADNLEDITEDAKGFLGTIFGLQTRVGLRNEFFPKNGGGRFYLTLEMRTRPDKFYYIEVLQDRRGDSPDVSLVYDPTTGRFRQEVVIEDTFRFTFQFAKRFDWLTLRYGIKESSGGIGADVTWFDNTLTLSADAYDFGFDELPRLKLHAAVEFFGMLYIIGGVDDVLNPPDELLIDPIGPTTIDGDEVPNRLRSMPLGRDYFVGAMLKFDDLDLAALLAVGGSAIAAIASD